MSLAEFQYEKLTPCPSPTLTSFHTSVRLDECDDAAQLHLTSGPRLVQHSFNSLIL